MTILDPTNSTNTQPEAPHPESASPPNTTSHSPLLGFGQVRSHLQRTLEQPPNAATATSAHPQRPVNRADNPSKRVAKLRAAVTEARGVVELQDDPALLHADTERVLRERRKAAEALKLATLATEPARKALRDNRVRRLVGVIGGAGLVGALGWSTANVQHTVTAGLHLTAADPGWWLAFLVEPVVSVGLLLIFGVRAYVAANRAITLIDDRLRRTELVLLAITLTINSWPYLPFVAQRFDPVQLLVHSIGPIVAVLLVTVIPVLWQCLTDAATDNAPPDPELKRWLTLAQQLLASGQLPVSPSRNALERALRTHGGRIRTTTAQRVHHCLTGKIRT